MATPACTSSPRTANCCCRGAKRGGGPWQFNLPHGIAVDSQGLVYVADRENSRLRILSPAGEYLREWTWVNRPDDVFIDDQDNLHIAELGFRTGNPPGMPHYRLMRSPPPGHAPIARVTIGCYRPRAAARLALRNTEFDRIDKMFQDFPQHSYSGGQRNFSGTVRPHSVAAGRSPMWSAGFGAEPSWMRW